ncbi:ABATE domain-containing protein [Rhodococcus sp. G-MC3]|uniref:CGNR zinc finger domain-containing protein n=1 Tax=Rhodococcus sp. G-MC3 TaxID=3046209 RepID=UPI0024BB20DC|nr:ABATE domain-containing protein [Rhodococcus sp. G-MC3]MDJ0396646.1 ABATE domain-containing protein [Rhodococcus sp. G-MC3]
MTILALPPAPGSDEHVSLALANTAVALPGGHRFDELTSPDATTEWLEIHGLVPDRTTLQSYCQNRLTGLRSDIRAALTAQVEGTVPPRHAVDGINRALASMPSAPVLQHDANHGFRRTIKHPTTRLVEHAMSQIAANCVLLLTGEDAGAIAQCQASPCDRFMLRTHARRHWCSVRCGDRVRAARAYARKQGTPP